MHLHAAASWKIGQNARWDQPCAFIPAIHKYMITKSKATECLHISGTSGFVACYKVHSNLNRYFRASHARAELAWHNLCEPCSTFLTSTANAVHSLCTKPALCKRNGNMQMPPRWTDETNSKMQHLLLVPKVAANLTDLQCHCCRRAIHTILFWARSAIQPTISFVILQLSLPWHMCSRTARPG